MTLTPRKAYTLGIHPSSRGVSWIVFQSPLAPFDFGNAAARSGDNNALCLKHVERVLARFEPETVVLEAFERRGSARADRTTMLGRAIVALAVDRGIEVAIYSRGEVKSCFATVGAVSRQQIAETIARHFPALRHRLPKPRKQWDSEPPRLALFSAAALVLTHYRYASSQLLDALQKKDEDDGLE